MVTNIFNQTWLWRYLCPPEFVFDNDSKFKQDFTHLLNYFSITPICISINNRKSNAPVERIHQVIYNIIVTKNLDRKVYDYIDYLMEILASYHSTLVCMSGNYMFGGDMPLNPTSSIDWRVVNYRKQRQVNIDKF